VRPCKTQVSRRVSSARNSVFTATASLLCRRATWPCSLSLLASTGPFASKICFLGYFPPGSQEGRAPSFGSLRGGTSRSLCRSVSHSHSCLPSFGLPCGSASTPLLALLRQHIELSLAFSQWHLDFTPGLALRWHLVPTPCLTICPRLQYLGFRGGGSFSPTNELDAGGTFGWCRSSTRDQLRSPSFVRVGARRFDSPRVGSRDCACRPKVIKVVSPVKANHVYIQLPDGDNLKTMLVQAWRVSAPNFVSSTNF